MKAEQTNVKAEPGKYLIAGLAIILIILIAATVLAVIVKG